MVDNKDPTQSRQGMNSLLGYTPHPLTAKGAITYPLSRETPMHLHQHHHDSPIQEQATLTVRTSPVVDYHTAVPARFNPNWTQNIFKVSRSPMARNIQSDLT
jgi:hypothetical protein